LLCKSFRKASASVAEQQDLQQSVDDAAGSMPVCFPEIPSISRAASGRIISEEARQKNAPRNAA